MDSQTENLVVPSEIVRYSVGEGQASLTVRGLGLAHILKLVRNHRDILEELYTQAVTGAMTLADVGDIAMELLTRSLPLAYDIGAEGCGHSIAGMPMSVQIAVIEKTISLTLAAEGGLGNVMEIVIRTMRATQTVSLNAPAT